MSFGFGIGDFLAVIKLAGELRSDFVNAPEEFKNITDEHYLDNPSETQQQTLESLTRTCNDVLEDVRKLRDKYSELDDTSEDGAANAPVAILSKRRRVREFWKRIKWDSSEIATLRQRQSSTLAALQAFCNTITHQKIHKVDKGVVHLSLLEDDRVREKILEWLTPTNYGATQSEFISRREDGTGQWFLDSPGYRDWIRQDRQTLFCPGIPGAGKTILTSIVVHELTAHFRADKTIGIAYLYCNFRRHHDQNITDLLASLLKQLAKRLSSTLSSLPSCLTALHAKHNDDGTRPSLQELSDTLHEVAGSFSRTFIIIDALDECQTTNGCQSRLISEMFDLQSKCRTNIFATSRFDPYIAERFSPIPAAVSAVSSDPYVAATRPRSTQLEIRASKNDIEQFLDGSISKLAASRDWDNELKDTIKTCISNVVDDMFLLAQIYLQSLDGKSQPGAVKKTLESMRRQEPGSSASQKQMVLNQVYDDTMKRINEHVEPSRDLAMDVLLWITFAERPLLAAELQHALAVKPDDLDLDLEYICKINRMISVCAGLVIVDAEGGIIRLVHHTTQQYLERKHHDLFPDAQYRMADTCATYLTFGTFTAEPAHSLLNDVSRYELLDYSSQNWGRHVCKSGKLGPRVANFLQNYKSLQRLCAMPGRGDLCSTPSFTFRPDFTVDDIRAIATHLSSYHGVDIAVKHLLDEGANINSTDDNGRTPLFYAAQNGHEAVVQLLRSRDNVVPDSTDNDGRIPFSYAAGNGRETVVRLLRGGGADLSLLV